MGSGVNCIGVLCGQHQVDPSLHVLSESSVMPFMSLGGAVTFELLGTECRTFGIRMDL